MRILLIGGGGREHALALKMSESPSFIHSSSELYCAPGNPGIARLAECIDIKPHETDRLLEFAIRNKIDLTVVGPEIPLSLGIADKFRESGLKIFGPGRKASEIESSKRYAKELMKRHNIPTAGFRSFSRSEVEVARDFIPTSKFPTVFKADGLAAGKGVIIAENESEANEALDALCNEDAFGEAAESFVIEEFLQGEEVSVFCVTDGTDYVLLPFSQDHKKIGEGETGKNTGGMGAIAPAKAFMNPGLEGKIVEKIIEPVLGALREEGRTFSGCLYCGLMIVENEPFVIEFNCRFGDPETQAVLSLISSDFLEMLLHSVEGNMKEYMLTVNDLYSSCVVISSGGYPDTFSSGYEITGLDEAQEIALVYHSGTSMQDGILTNTGGRVLSVVGTSLLSLEDALSKTYEAVSRIHFRDMYYRNDIGKKFLERTK